MLLRKDTSMHLRSSALILILFLAAASTHAADGDLCSYSENTFIDVVGGAAAGTALTSAMAGESMVIIVTSNALLVGTAPVVAPAVVVGAATATAAYATLKAWCSRGEVGNFASTWYQSSIDTTSNHMEVAVDAQGKAINYTTRVYEEVNKKRVNASSRLTDYLCSVTGDC
jgi:hypothetical protein